MRALIIVDVQNDFLPGGALAVPEGDQIINVINALEKECDIVIASKDWHPKDHVSFQTWPQHCVQGTEGANFPKGLHTEKIEQTFLKGEDIEEDSFSAFREMEPYLKEKKVKELWIVGLALDYCVKATALDAAECGWKTTVILDACRAIKDPTPTIKDMKDNKIKVLQGVMEK